MKSLVAFIVATFFGLMSLLVFDANSAEGFIAYLIGYVGTHIVLKD